ncbi:macrophage mannose receptor 1-like [Hemitrygon akajei]|uniref:macrophage mannose receptor 1-like n=1 Tax=Hemitrygon akajei TaxID=2704970 RepID=UPI003BF99FB2
MSQGPSQMSESAGREYHRIQEPKNWTEAWDYCRSVFTDLASVRNLEEWEEVSRYAQQGEWIGLHNDNLTSSVWKWTTGEVFNYSNWEPWKPQELSTSSLSCVYTSTNQWFNADCDIPLSFICHKGQLKVSITTKPNSWAVQPTKASDAEPLAAPVSREGDTSTDRATDSSETGLHLISKLSGRSYHLVPEMKSWAQAREHCQRMFTDLASIPSREEEGVIIHFAAPGERLWIGLYNDGQSPNGWKWTTGESFSYNNWAPWYTEDFNTTFPICVYIDVDQWMDTNCDITLSFICYKDPLQQLIAPDSEALLAKPANLSGTEIPVPLSAEGPKASSLQTTTTIEREKDNFQTLEAFLTNLSSSGVTQNYPAFWPGLN